MFRIQKNHHHTYSQGNHILFKERRSTNANPEMNTMLKLSHKNYKATIIKMCKQIITNSLEMRNIETLREETEIRIKKQMEITELKNTVSF